MKIDERRNWRKFNESSDCCSGFGFVRSRFVNVACCCEIDSRGSLVLFLIKSLARSLSIVAFNYSPRLYIYGGKTDRRYEDRSVVSFKNSLSKILGERKEKKIHSIKIDHDSFFEILAQEKKKRRKKVHENLSIECRCYGVLNADR